MRARPFASMAMALLIGLATCIGLAAPAQAAMAQAAKGWSENTAMPCCPERAQPVCAPTCAQLCQGMIPEGWTPTPVAPAIVLKFRVADTHHDGLRHGPEPPPPRSS